MDKDTYQEAITCLNAIITYTKFMTRAEDSEKFSMFFREYDTAHQRLLEILKEAVNDSK